MSTPGRDLSRPEVVWIERENLAGLGCSDCAWVFHPSGPPIGGTLEEMKQNFQTQLSKEFDSHDCAKHQLAKGTTP